MFLLNTTNSIAQKRNVEFINKENNLRNVFKLPHPCLIQLFEDTEGYYSRAILDSVKNDSFYISSPKKPYQSLSVSFKEVKEIKLPPRDLIDPLKALSSGYFALSTLSLIYRGIEGVPSEKIPSLIMATVFSAGLSTTIYFAGRSRSFTLDSYNVKHD